MAVLLREKTAMRKLQLVRVGKEDTPRRGRGATVSTERRYRYPAEEIWEVSDDRWQAVKEPWPLTIDEGRLTDDSH